MARHKAFHVRHRHGNSSATKARFPDHEAPIPCCLQGKDTVLVEHTAPKSATPHVRGWMTTVVGANPVRMRFREANIHRSTLRARGLLSQKQSPPEAR